MDIAVSELRVLAQYEGKGFKTPVEAAQLRLNRMTAERDALLLKTAREDASETLEALPSVPHIRDKLKKLDILRIKISEYRRRCGDSQSVDIIERRIKTTSFRIRLSNRLEEAAEAEADQQPEDAKRLYQEALELMKMEGRDDRSFKSQFEKILQRLKSA